MSTPIPKAKITTDRQMLALACANLLCRQEDIVHDPDVILVAQMFAQYEAAVRADSVMPIIGTAQPKAVEQFLLSL